MRLLGSTSYCVLGIAVFVLSLDTARAQGAATPIDPQVLADRIQADVAEIRGLPFKAGVRAENQSLEAFEEYIDGTIAQTVPLAIAEHYGAIVRKLGLFKGPEALDLPELMKGVMTSQAAAYYDPEKRAFFVLAQNLPQPAMEMFYSHELYHGLQDQYFDLSAYLLDGARTRSLDDDSLLARQAVIEGEATYIMSLWTLKNTLGAVPPRAVLAEMVRLQSDMDLDTLRAALDQPGVAALLGGDLQDALDSATEIPAFIMETMMGVYLKGLAFVFAVQEHGWPEVEKLYAEYPPASTEQILHPEKWFARESPATIAWPAFDGNRLFAGWNLLEQNVLGEFQWRIVFAEHGLGDAAASAAAGWNGDRFAVLKRGDSDRLLLLWYTSWDSEADAAEFAEAYEQLLAVKYVDAPEPTRLARDGRDVLIVEGSDEASIDAVLRFVERAAVSRP